MEEVRRLGDFAVTCLVENTMVSLSPTVVIDQIRLINYMLKEMSEHERSILLERCKATQPTGV